VRWWRLAILSGGLSLLAGCGGVTIAPKSELPRALVDKIPAKVGLLLGSEQRSYKHIETRGGVDWSVDLGEGHQALSRQVFTGLFADVVELSELDIASSSQSLQGIFEPKIELFSFATARETGGEYVAVTIRYVITVLTPEGEVHDRLTLTGYGSNPTSGLSSSDPVAGAARAAMRDAAAKILTQLPSLAVAKELATGVRLASSQSVAAGRDGAIEAVPIRESRRLNPLWRPGSGS
jgi:hypothetical protein